MADRICSVEDCERKARTRGWCSAHYMRWSRHGGPLAGCPVERLKPPRMCSINGCGREVIGRDWCSQHYDRWKRYGHPLASAPKEPDSKRFWAKVERTNSCWIWRGHHNNYGYGRFGYEGREVFAHRYAYEFEHGTIPGNLVIDHRCHNPLCVRPSHLRAVTHKQNIEHRQGPTVASSTGFLGVFKTRNGRYVGRVGHYGVQYQTSTFRTAEEANEAVVELRNALFTHNDNDRMGA